MREMKLLIPLLILAAGCATAGEVTTVDGVVHVANGATPSDGVTDVTLTELWRRGGEDDDVFFGMILKALSDEDGNVYLLDMQLAQVFVFGPDGQELGTLSREGDGPGEVRQPTDMIWMPDGTLGIVQSFPGRVIKVTKDDQPAGIFKTGAEGAIIALVEARSGGGNTVLGVVDVELGQGGQDRHIFIGSFDDEGNELCRYTGFDVHWDFSNLVLKERNQYFVMYGRWDILPDGRVIAPPDRYAYAFDIFAKDGTVERSVSREFEPYRREESDYAVARAIMDGTSRMFPFPVETEVEDVETPIGQLMVHPDGHIWVLNTRGMRGQETGVLASYDVFDLEGHFRHQVRLLGEGNALQDGILFLDDERVLVISGMTDALTAQFGGSAADEAAEEAEPIEVICYRVN